MPYRFPLYRPFLVTLLAAAAFLAGCAGSGRLRYDSAQEAYEKGLDFYERGNYDRAIEYFQAVFDFGRATEWADDAQLHLARAYRMSRQHLLAANEYTRFTDIYRADPRAAEAEFERALSYEALSPGYQLDQTDTQRALSDFQLFLNRHPDHELAPQAEEHIRALREKLARKQYETAGLYVRRDLHEAAALSYEETFSQYPDTPWADDALVESIRAYIAFAEQSVEARQPERLREAIENYERFIQIFGTDSPLAGEAESLYEEAVGAWAPSARRPRRWPGKEGRGSLRSR